MTSDDRESLWGELEGQAARLLEHPRDLDPRATIRAYGSLWRLWHYPPFAAQVTWTVLTPGRKAPPGAPPLVREVTWDRRRDHDKLFDPAAASPSPNPAMQVRDAYLPADQLQRLVQEGARLAVPLIVFARAAPLDEEVFGLETYEVSPFVRVQWWGDGPPPWRHFTDWVTGVRAFLLRQLEEAG